MNDATKQTHKITSNPTDVLIKKLSFTNKKLKFLKRKTTSDYIKKDQHLIVHL